MTLIRKKKVLILHLKILHSINPIIIYTEKHGSS